MKTLDKINHNFSINESIKFKDCSLKFILKHRPEIVSILQSLKESVPQRTYLTINVHEQALEKSEKTCKNINWHVDGTNEDYVLVCFGQYRTEFLINNEATEAGDGVPVIYTSQDLHRGRTAQSESKRLLIRLCSSDKIRPTNTIIRGNR